MDRNQNVIASIAKPPCFSWRECLWFLDRGYDDCLFAISGECITKVVAINEKLLLISIEEEEDTLVIKCLNKGLQSEDTGKIISFVTEWFDMKRDLQPFYKLLDKQTALSYMTSAYHGLRLIGIPDLYEALCWSIIGQQINLNFAYALKRRFVEAYGECLQYRGANFFHFPNPGVIAGVTEEQLKNMQFSRQKASYLINLSKLFASGAISKAKMLAVGNYEAKIAFLTQVQGIGSWTANYALMKSLKEMNSITYGDVGLNKALSVLLNFDKRPTKEAIDSLFKDFEGWKAYLVFYLWRSLTAPVLQGKQERG